jgi:hypothetical protein
MAGSWLLSLSGDFVIGLFFRVRLLPQWQVAGEEPSVIGVVPLLHLPPRGVLTKHYHDTRSHCCPLLWNYNNEMEIIAAWLEVNRQWCHILPWQELQWSLMYSHTSKLRGTWFQDLLRQCKWRQFPVNAVLKWGGWVKKNLIWSRINMYS